MAEIYEAFYSFATLVNKGPSALSNLHLYTDDGPPPPPVSSSSSSSSSSSKSIPHVHTKSDTTQHEAKVAWLDTWKSRVNLQDLTLVGHSFGGGTLLHLLQIRPPQGFEKLPVKKAVALDPWCVNFFVFPNLGDFIRAWGLMACLIMMRGGVTVGWTHCPCLARPRN